MEWSWWTLLQTLHRLFLLNNVSRLAYRSYKLGQTLHARRGGAVFWLQFWLSLPFIRLGQWLRNRKRGFGIPYKEAFTAPLLPTPEEWRLEQRREDCGVDGARFFGGSGDVSVDMSVEYRRSGTVRTTICIVAKGHAFSAHSIQITPTGTSNNCFEAGGLRLELREPMRRWKLDYCGYLKSSNGKDYFCTFEAWFAAASDAFYPSAHVASENIAIALDESINFRSTACDIWSLMKFEEVNQLGQFTTRLHIEDHMEEMEMVLKGQRQRVFRRDEPEVGDWEKELVAYFEDGEAFGVRLTDVGRFSSELSRGFRSARHGSLDPLRLLDPSLHFAHFPHKGIILNCVAGNEGFEIESESLSQEIWMKTVGGWEIGLQFVALRREGFEGWGVVTTRRLLALSTPISLPNWSRQPLPAGDSDELVLSLGHKDAASAELSGGKGANLALLSSLQGSEFTVPSGLVVTTNGYAAFLGENPDLQLELERLDKLDKRDICKIKAHCERISSHMRAAVVPDAVKKCVSEEIQRSFGCTDQKWAVRSSAVGEDGAELSSAGQLLTFLNLESLHQVWPAIVDCWASNFREEVVSYRRQHGLGLTPGMGVVVQAMAAAEAAGVLFSIHPTTRDPRRIVINANPGLGEAVVDGSVIPDAITLHRSAEDVLTIEERQVGSGAQSSVCLNDDVALRLGALSVRLAKSFQGRPQDIEFAVAGDHIYLLQSRDITTLGGDSDWALLHEFDTAILGHNDVVSTGNVGEVLGEALTPLGCSTALCLERAIEAQMASQGVLSTISPHVNHFFVLHRQRAFINLIEGMYRNMKDVTDERDRDIFEIAFMGRPLRDPRIIQAAHQRFPKATLLGKLFMNGHPLMMLLGGSKRLVRQMDDYVAAMEKVETAGKCPEQLLQLAADNLFHITKRIASSIRASGQVGDLEERAEDDAASWLQNGASKDTIAQVGEFRRLHGHRCPQEFDYGRVTWGSDLRLIVPAIKQLLASPPETLEDVKTETTAGEAVEALRSPLSANKKRLLRHIIIPRARIGVECREQAKNKCVWTVNEGRRLYAALGEELARRGLFPDARSVFFATHSELQALLRGPNPPILQRMLRRRRLMDTQSAAEYAEVIHGNPKALPPMAAREPRSYSSEARGTQVCLGKVEGLARVAVSLAEARHTKVGEILITRSTDIGWSPLFPLVAGVVTELGGLLSHGAVVAREYGLPCLIGVQDATRIFKTGDRVELDSAIGIIRKID